MGAGLPLGAGFRYLGPSMSNDRISGEGALAPEDEKPDEPASQSDANGSEPQETAARPTADGGEADAGDEIAVEVDDSEVEAAAPTDAQRIATLEARIQELEAQHKDTYDRLLRATADLDNFRKRSRRDVQDARVDARASALREILPVVDNLERALQHAETSAEPGGVIDGVKLVLRQFAQALERCEVTPIEAEGLAFDPNVHEAISQIETEEQDPGTVVHVMQRGYRIGERLLRPSMVVVAKAPAASGNSADKGNGAAAGTPSDGGDDPTPAGDAPAGEGDADDHEKEGD